jgi:hypothetical protein
MLGYILQILREWATLGKIPTRVARYRISRQECDTTTFSRSLKVALRACPSKMSIARENSSNVVWSRIAHIVKCPLSCVVVLLYACENWCLFCAYSIKDISRTRTQFGTTAPVSWCSRMRVRTGGTIFLVSRYGFRFREYHRIDVEKRSDLLAIRE